MSGLVSTSSGNSRSNTSNFRRFNNPNWRYWEGSDTGPTSGWKTNLKNWFAKGKNSVDNSLNTMFGPGQTGYSFRGGAGKPAGLKVAGKNLGGWATGLNAGYQGLQAINNLGELDNAADNIEDLLSRIRTSASGNPLLSSYLTSDQLNTLGKVQRDTYDNDIDFNDFLSGMNLKDIATGALMGLPGGLPGVLVGGIGGLVNSGIKGATEGVSDNTGELEALYRALMDAEMQYNSMKRPNFAGLGIQQRYQDMYR